MEKGYKLPAIVWLKVTDYMLPWVQHELGGALRVGEQLVVSIQDLPGAREAFTKYETENEIQEHKHVGFSMSATWRNCIDAGMMTDPAMVEQTYGVTREDLKLFVPIECPKRGLTKNGVLRRWTLDVNFSRQQATAMLKVLRHAFWTAVEDHNRAYAQRMGGKKYPAIDMIEDFCKTTETPDLYVDAMRREWQRRLKRGGTDQ